MTTEKSQMNPGSTTPRAVYTRLFAPFGAVRRAIYRFVYRRPRLRRPLGRVRVALWTAYSVVHRSAHVLVTRLRPSRPPRAETSVVMKPLVVYLIRPGDGFRSFRRFVESYRRFPEPLDHDMLVIFKGFASRPHRAAYYQELAGLRFLEMEKIDFGQDIGSFHLALRRFAYSHYLFLGAHCQIMAEGYLTKMMHCLNTCPKAALVGPAGFCTSLVVLLSPPFPNYAIRTNAFLAPRDILLKVRWPAVLSKVDAWAFEYGWCNLTRQILDMDLEPYVVAADGSCFPKERWLESRTFWHTDQANLLIGDKRTDLFRDADPSERLRLAMLAWGERGREVCQ